MLLERAVQPSHIPAMDNHGWGRVGGTPPTPATVLEVL